jgi:DNA-binding NarL/FixJ family response regulator
VDDQALVLRGLSKLLTDLGFEVAIEAVDATQLMAQLPTIRPDVIVSDIRMPGVDGIELLRKLRDQRDSTPVILLTTFDDHELLLRAINAGAQGLLLKDASPEELASSIERVAHGERLLQPLTSHPVRDRLGLQSSAGDSPRLTDRERSILRLVAGGYSNKEIARALNLSEGTIKNYITDLLVKLDSRDRTHAVLKAITRGLI